MFRESCESNNIKLEDLIDIFNSDNPDWKLKIDRGWRIFFPYQIIEDFMFQLTNKIIDYILEIMNNVKNIKYLIFTGGASINQNLKRMIQGSEDLQSLNFVQSHNPELAISQGSVLFAYNHNIASTRKARYSFGIKVYIDWDEREHAKGGIKEFSKIDNKYKCINYFDKFIKKNEDINPEEEIERFYRMIDSKVTVEIYKSEEDNAYFCDEKDENGELKVSKFGEFIIDAGNNFICTNILFGIIHILIKYK